MSTIAELATLLEEICPGDGYHATAVQGFYVNRWSTLEVPRTSLEQPVLCVVAQGAKSVLLESERVLYDEGTFLLVSLHLPLAGQIERATKTKPFLGVALVLDFEEIRFLAQQMELPGETDPILSYGLQVGHAGDELVDAVIRLLRVSQGAEQAAVLAPLFRREIYIRLLMSKQGDMLRQMANDRGLAPSVAKGLDWLRQHYREPIAMEDLARAMAMSSSAMYTSIRRVTGMSPLQYLKQLRLQEARRALLFGENVVGEVSRQVGYSSLSQFSREYRRFFGCPPQEDIRRLRGSTMQRESRPQEAPRMTAQLLA